MKFVNKKYSKRYLYSFLIDIGNAKIMFASDNLKEKNIFVRIFSKVGKSTGLLRWMTSGLSSFGIIDESKIISNSFYQRNRIT